MVIFHSYVSLPEGNIAQLLNLAAQVARLLKLFGGLLCVSARTSTIFLRKNPWERTVFTDGFNMLQCGSMTIP
jgi:hypothetical protein